MTAVRSFWFICNVCDEASGPGGVAEHDTRTEAWEYARDIGGFHKRPNGRHVCGDCWDQGER